MKRMYIAVLICVLAGFGHATMQAIDLGENDMKNVCVGGLDPEDLSHRKYLEAFARGPCKPVMMVPGIVSTRLSIKINYEEVKKYHPEIVAACHWNDSDHEKDVQNIWPPNSRFEAGISNFMSCFSELFKIGVKKVGQTYKVKYRKGLDYFPNWKGKKRFGFEIKHEECGFRATNSLITMGMGFIGRFDIMRPMYDELYDMGYRSNLTMAPFPYDWRANPKWIVAQGHFGNLAKLLYLLNGKPIVIAAHSYGSVVSYQGILSLSPKVRSAIIDDWVTIGATWLGSTMTLDILLGSLPPPNGSSHVLEKLLSMANRFEYFEKMLSNLAGFYSLAPKDNFVKYRNTPWLQKVLYRIQYENTGKIFNGKIPYSNWLPKREFFCDEKERAAAQSGDVNHQIDSQCTLGLVDYKTAAIVNGKEWRMNEIAELLQQYSMAKDAGQKYSSWADSDTLDWPNPNVRTWHVFTNRVPTVQYSTWENLASGKKSDFSPAKTQLNCPGDGQVSTISNIIAGLKWADDFDNGVEGAKPVKLVHYCSNLQERYKDDPNVAEFVDEKEQNKKFYEKKNGYWGIDCMCSKSSLLTNFAGKIVPDMASLCGHIPMFQDKTVIKTVRRVAKSGRGISSNKFLETKVSEKMLSEFVENCQLEKPVTLKNIDTTFGLTDSDFINQNSGKVDNTPRQLTIQQKKADMKDDLDSWSKMDPFIRFKIGKGDPENPKDIRFDQDKEKNSKIMNNAGKRPVWNQDFVYYNLDPSHVVLVELQDHDTMSDDFGGSFSITIKEIYEKHNNRLEWFDMYDKSRRNITGRVQIQFSLANASIDLEIKEDSSSVKEKEVRKVDTSKKWSESYVNGSFTPRTKEDCPKGTHHVPAFNLWYGNKTAWCQANQSDCMTYNLNTGVCSFCNENSYMISDEYTGDYCQSMPIGYGFGFALLIVIFLIGMFYFCS